MPLRLPAFLQPATGPDTDTSRRWLWVALLTGVLALLLAGLAVVQYAGPGPEPTRSGHPPAGEDPTPAANHLVRY